MPLAISPPTNHFLRLVEMAAVDCGDQTISAQKKPVTKLISTSSCEDVQKEFRRSYQNKIESGSSTATVFDPTKIESRWLPETLVLSGGTFGIPDQTSAVVIPLVKDRNPRIEYIDAHGTVSSIDWNIGSVIYLARNSKLTSDGSGNASCIFLLFKMRA